MSQTNNQKTNLKKDITYSSIQLPGKSNKRSQHFYGKIIKL